MIILWLSFACLAAAVVVALLRPLARGGASPAASGADADIAVYRDQLSEVEAERGRGILGEREAEAARIEISRRLLAAAERAGPPPALRPAGAGLLSRTALATAIAVPLAAIALYLSVGSPALRDQPRAARSAPEPRNARADELIRMVEVRLKEHPDDGDGWDVIAPVYLRIERFKEASHAYAQAIRLKGETMKRLAGLAEAHVLAENGIIGDAARQAYQRMSRLDPKHPIPRFWLALAKEQDGELKAALEDYEALIKEAAPDADYREPVQQRLDLVRKRLASAGAGDAARAPAIDPKSATAIERLPPEEQLRAINAMVDGLAARLDKNGRDLEGWQRLIRAYVVLKKQEDAKRALARARVALADDKAALEALAALASGLGLGS